LKCPLTPIGQKKEHPPPSVHAWSNEKPRLWWAQQRSPNC
jgi:hypothetical protein